VGRHRPLTAAPPRAHGAAAAPAPAAAQGAFWEMHDMVRPRLCSLNNAAGGRGSDEC